MARRVASRNAQRGMALLATLAAATLVFAYLLTSRLNAASQFVGLNRTHNAQALAQAKQALVGWIALNAASTDTNPGRLPCPEAPGYFGNPTQEGIAAASCTLPAVGRLPWRTLGLKKLVDAVGEPLWYVVSPSWAIPSPGATLTINSDSVGQLTVDGTSNDAVALIIAPGPVLNAQACGGSAAWVQSRPAAGPPDLRNYLECTNATSPADATFVTSAAGNAFNDQVLRVTSADVLPVLEAAIADRMQREIAPALKAAAYTSTQYVGLPASVPLYPYPVPFADPSTSGYLGAAGAANPQGLLPFNQINATCTSPPPCTSLPLTGTNRVVTGFGFGGYLVSYSCSASATELLCQGQYHEDTGDPSLDVRIEMNATFENVAMGFRALDANPVSKTLVEAKDNSGSTWQTPSPTIVQIRMNDGATTLPDGTTPPRGSVSIRFRATMPNIDANGWGSYADFRMRINRAAIADHALLNKADATLGWFVRNEWYRNTYYAVAQPNTADGLPSLGCTAASSNCIRFNDHTTQNIRALFVLAGRRLPTQGVRPSSNRLDYVEPENGDGLTTYEQRIARMSKVAITSPFQAPWNDRVVLVDWDPASPPNALQVVSMTPLRVVSLP
jgi:hypothetical protein